MQVTLQEQLRAALNKWEKEENEQAAQQAQPVSYQKASPFQVTNNLNRTAFNELQQQPGTRKQVTDRLLARGFKLGSVSAVLGHMLRQGLAQKDDEGVIHVTVPEYVPLKSYKTLQNMKKKAAKKKVTQIVVDVRNKKVEEKRPVSSSVGGIAAIMRPKDLPPPAPLPWSVREVLESLSVLQARAVYDELRKIFGDVK